MFIFTFRFTAAQAASAHNDDEPTKVLFILYPNLWTLCLPLLVFLNYFSHHLKVRFRFFHPKFDCYFTEFKRIGLQSLLPFWVVEPLGLTIQAKEDFIQEWLQYLTILIFRLLSFFKESNTWISFCPLPRQSWTTTSRVSSFFFSHWTFIVIFVFCTIFPCYVTAWASNLLAAGSYE